MIPVPSVTSLWSLLALTEAGLAKLGGKAWSGTCCRGEFWGKTGCDGVKA